MKNLKLSLISCVSVALLLLSASCSPQPEPIRIGATMSLSGSTATQGTAAHNGYLLCEQHINEDGGLLGRPIAFTIHDDASDNDTAIALYEQLITEENVDLVMGPYGSTLTEAVAPVTERHQFVHISPLAATTSIWEQGREYLFMILPPAERFLSGLIELADDFGLKSVAIIQEDALFPRAAGDGAAEMAVERGMDVTMHYTYPRGKQDFSEIISTLRHTNTQVVGMAASTLSDFARFVEQLHESDTNLEMFGTSGAVQEFQQTLGEKAEYVFGLSAWEPSLQNPGIERFVRDYTQRFDLDPSFHAAGAYAACQVLAEAIKQSESLNQQTLRQVLLDLQMQTILSDYAVDERGYQIANTGLFIQWQQGRKEVVWPDEVATAEIWFPVPNWSER